ncbi:hypothetical protein [Legionella gresilensis]|uniref:hypothetical protein n=1 Tax=Legionella gresilensis TaxID=91823 RepID=UPI001040F672|nr:hypothetical protein [Legionella gresilensis]
MKFKAEKVDSKRMLEVLSDWEKKFLSKKRNKIETNAQSIATQMIKTLKDERHAHFLLAKSDESNKPCALLIGDEKDKLIIIRFILSNVFDTDAKGSGRFLVEAITKFADAKKFSIRTTSQNADAFWKKCPGFKLDEANPPDFIYKPDSLFLQYPKSPQQFFKEEDNDEKTTKSENSKTRYTRSR